MKTVSKKLLSLLLVAILLVSAIPFQALAEEPVAGDTASVAEPTPDAAPASADATPVTPASADATPVTPASADATPVTPASADATPVTPAPSDATPVTPAPSDATPVTSTPSGAAPLADTPATPFEHNGNFCQVSGWKKNDTHHWIECLTENCQAYIAGTHLDEAVHVFKDESGNPKDCVCGAKCGVDRAHDYQLANVKAPTCIGEGYSGDMVCTVCGAKDLSQPGKTIPATGVHTFDPNTHVCTTPGCGKTEDGTAAQLTLDANGGSINGGVSMNVNVITGKPISSLPDATRPGYTFGGWWTELTGGVRVYAATTFDGSFNKVYARWVENTFPLTVRYVLNGDFSTARSIKTLNPIQVPAGTPLLDYLNTNVKSLVLQELALHPGFTWEYKFWKDYSGRQPLTDQTTCMNQAQTVFVNFVSQSYNLYFHPNEGSVSTNFKPVYFGSAVGTLPIPYREGKVFKGWEDANGVEYTATTVYQVAGDTTLTAKWQDEATVLLYVYINGNFAACDRMIAMDQFVQNDNISRGDVYAEIAKHYVPASGYLNIAGLFDPYAWESYRSNTSKPGVENIQIDSSRVNRIYVMVTNALTGSTIVTNPGGTITLPGGSTITIPQNSYWVATGTNTGYWVQGTAPQGSYWVSTGNGNGYWVYPTAGLNPGTIVYPTIVWVGTNPKTGDTSMIEAAAAVMVLAAAALVTVISLRKRKMAK